MGYFNTASTAALPYACVSDYCKGRLYSVHQLELEVIVYGHQLLSGSCAIAVLTDPISACIVDVTIQLFHCLLWAIWQRTLLTYDTVQLFEVA